MNFNKIARWKKEGIGWGIWMFVSMGIVFPLVYKREFNLLLIIFHFFFYMIAGMVMSYISTHFFQKRIKVR